MPQIPVSLYSIHLILMLFPAALALVMYILITTGGAGDVQQDDNTKVFQIVASVFVVISVGLSQLIPRLLLREEKKIPMSRYVSMKIVQWAVLEGAATLTIVVFYLTQQKTMLVPVGVLIALIAFMRPTLEEAHRYNAKE